MTWTTCDLDNELASGDKIVESISLNNSLLVIGEKSIAEINGIDGTKSTKKALLSYGIKNFIVARAFYQGIEILKFFSLSETQNLDTVKKETIKLTLLKIMKHLLASLKISEKIELEVEEARKAWLLKTISPNQIVSIPSIKDLDELVGSFLAQSKFALKLFTDLIEPFCSAQPSKAQSGDTCLITDGKLQEWVSKNLNNKKLVDFIKDRSSEESPLKHIINLRNRYEHDHKTKGSLIIYNFRREGNNLLAPMWALKGESPYSISKSMNEIPRIILENLEILMILFFENYSLPWPCIIIEVGDEERDPHKPIRFKIAKRQMD